MLAGSQKLKFHVSDLLTLEVVTYTKSSRACSLYKYYKHIPHPSTSTK